MTHADWFQTLAEIGLGFAGFSALIAGFVFAINEDGTVEHE